MSARKIQLSEHEQLLLLIASADVPKLESALRIIKVRLAQLKPRAKRPKVEKVERAS